MSADMSKRQRTLTDVAVDRMKLEGERPWRALRRATAALTPVALLAIAAQDGAGEDGRWPKQVEYAAYWEMDVRMAQRQWQDFENVFGEDADINAFAHAIVDAYPGRRLTRRDVGIAHGFPADLALA
jgi:hypothetical protein